MNAIPAEFFELLNRYPSPHNGQPIRLEHKDAGAYTMYFERTRGLTATDISYIFSFVTMGVFVQHALYVARSFGFDTSYKLALPKESALRGIGDVAFGTITFTRSDMLADESLQLTLRERQTSRKKYISGVPSGIIPVLKATAMHNNMKLVHLIPSVAHQVIWLNQRAVFDDLFDEPVRKELDHWLRYTEREKREKRDGLSYDCMELNGSLLHRIVTNPKILKNKLVMGGLKKYYLRTMSDESDVFYLDAPFTNEHDSFNVGLTIMQLWLQIAQASCYLHPFGTVVSNVQAHADFLKLVKKTDETRESYVMFIFRAGESVRPNESLRIPYQTHLLHETDRV